MKQANFPNDYHPQENPNVILSNCVVVKTIETDLGLCPVNRVIDHLKFIEHVWQLHLSRPNDFKIAKRILLNSILYN